MAIHESETFRSLHILGEHLLAAARYDAVGRIGLTVVPGGIATPSFGSDNRSLGVVDGELVVRFGGRVSRAPITTLRDAGEFMGVTPGGPDQVYRLATPCRLDAPLHLDPDELQRIVHWYQLVTAALEQFRDELDTEEASDITLWPEHFDVAIRSGEVNYGGLMGDAKVPRPYVYVGPPVAALPNPPAGFWNTPFGAARSEDQVGTTADVLDFFRTGREAIDLTRARSRQG
jgi:hypothetical protein